MEHASLSAITIGSKDIATSIACSDHTLIHINQTSAFIDRRGYVDWYISFVIRNICNKISIDFGWNTNDGIGVKPLRTIRSIIPQITIMKSGTEMGRIGFRQNNNDSIPPRNIERFRIFDRRVMDLFDRSAS